MADTKTPEERSANMAAIRSTETKPEVFMRKLLFAKGYRYRKNVKYLPGHPDIYLGKYKTAIFVHGCFWHHHEGCKYAYVPKSRMDYWIQKFERNRKRDREVQEELKKTGIRCLVVWECTINKMKRNGETREMVLQKIQRFLDQSEKDFLEI